MRIFELMLTTIIFCYDIILNSKEKTLCQNSIQNFLTELSQDSELILS